MGNDAPKVSVILSTYNGEKYLVEALESVLSQDFLDLEFVVVDDGSSDRTVEILEGFAKRDSRLKFFRNPENRGTGYSYSFLLETVRGRYIAAIGQDDRWEEGFLASCVGFLDATPASSVVFSQVKIIDSDGNDKPADHAPFRTDIVMGHSQEDLMVFLIRHNFLCAGAAVFRAKDIAGWHTLGDNDQLQDWNTWQHLVLMGPFHIIPKTLVSYRVHGNNLSLGGHNPALVRIELLQTRLEMIRSREFAQFIMKSANPNALFYSAMAAYSETIDPRSSTHYFCLLQALRKNEDLLRALSSYRDVMAMLFLQMGAIQKSRRYSNREVAAMECPPLFWRGFEWRYLFMPSSHVGAAGTSSPFVKTRKKGPLLCAKMLVRIGRLPKWGFSFSPRGASAERIVERHLDAQGSLV